MTCLITPWSRACLGTSSHTEPVLANHRVCFQTKLVQTNRHIRAFRFVSFRFVSFRLSPPGANRVPHRVELRGVRLRALVASVEGIALAARVVRAVRTAASRILRERSVLPRCRCRRRCRRRCIVTGCIIASGSSNSSSARRRGKSEQRDQRNAFELRVIPV